MKAEGIQRGARFTELTSVCLVVIISVVYITVGLMSPAVTSSTGRSLRDVDLRVDGYGSSAPTDVDQYLQDPNGSRGLQDARTLTKPVVPSGGNSANGTPLQGSPAN